MLNCPLTRFSAACLALIESVRTIQTELARLVLENAPGFPYLGVETRQKFLDTGRHMGTDLSGKVSPFLNSYTIVTTYWHYVLVLRIGPEDVKKSVRAADELR